MLINVHIIEAGYVMDATPQKCISCLFVAVLQKLKPVWILNGQNLSFRAHLMNF